MSSGRRFRRPNFRLPCFGLALILGVTLAVDAARAEPPIGFEVYPEDTAVLRYLEGLVEDGVIRDADAATIQELHARLLGHFPDIRFAYVTRRVEGKGLLLGVHFIRYEIVSDIVFEGNDTVRSGELQSALPLKKGQISSPGVLQELAAAVSQVYSGYGFFSPEIEVETEPSRHGVKVNIRIRENDRAMIRTVTFEGDLGPFKASKLRSLSRLRPNQPYTRDRIYRAVHDIRRAYFGKRHFLVEINAQEQRTADGNIDLRVVVRAGSRFQIVVLGDPRIRDRGVLSLIEIEKTTRFDAATLEQWSFQIREGLQKRGYAFAKVSVREEVKETSRSVVIQVSLEDKLAVRSIRLSGNKSVPDSRLKKILLTRVGSRIPFFSKGALVDSDLRRDVRRIEDYYHANGYLDARVTDTSLDRSPGTPYLTVSFFIREGVQIRVADLKIEGMPESLGKKGRSLLKLNVGKPFNPAYLKEDELALQALLTRNGYLDARVQGMQRIAEKGREAAVAFEVVPGEVSYVGEFIIERSGRRFKTRETVIAREIPLDKGEVLSQASLADGQLRLFRLGFFREVQVRPSPYTYLGEDERSFRDVLIDVEERPAKEIAFGPGYDTDNQFGAFVEGSIKNLFGSGRSLNARGQFSQKDQFYRTSYSEPWIFGFDLTLRSTLSYEVDIDTADLEFDRTELAGTVGTEKRFGNSLTLTLQQRVARTVRDGAKVEAGTVDRRTIKSFLTPGLTYDRRDDFFNPKTGYLLSTEADFSTKLLGSQVEFIRPTAGAAKYFNLFGEWVFATGVRGGYIFPLKTLDLVEAKADEDLFRLGGRDSLRGFGQGEVIVPEEDDARTQTFSSGGNVFAHANEELRFPIPTFLPFKMGGVLFFDAGNVWKTQSAGRHRIGSPYLLRTDAGVAFRLITPIGPISAYVAFNLKPRDDLGKEDSFQVGFAIGEFF